MSYLYAKALAPLMAAFFLATVKPFLRVLKSAVPAPNRERYLKLVNALGPGSDLGAGLFLGLILALGTFGFGWYWLPNSTGSNAPTIAALIAGLVFYAYFFVLMRWRATRAYQHMEEVMSDEP
ncbi:MAG: hypothetical protein JST54_05660 [Deltaproteobacteria bacterium]|nr:hypothetical protein [Deltaproteobacteria bacterium]